MPSGTPQAPNAPRRGTLPTITESAEEGDDDEGEPADPAVNLLQKFEDQTSWMREQIQELKALKSDMRALVEEARAVHRVDEMKAVVEEVTAATEDLREARTKEIKAAVKLTEDRWRAECDELKRKYKAMLPRMQKLREINDTMATEVEDLKTKIKKETELVQRMKAREHKMVGQ